MSLESFIDRRLTPDKCLAIISMKGSIKGHNPHEMPSSINIAWFSPGN